MSENKFFVIDFDSTFMQVEAMDEMAAISLQNHPQGSQRIEEIRAITNRAMEGKMPFSEALKRRIGLLDAHHHHIPQVVEALKGKVSPSFKRNKSFFEQFSGSVLIISSGFRELIVPIVQEYGIAETNVYANTFIYDANGKIVGVDEHNPLAQDKGKVTLLHDLNLTGDVYVIGDGYTDYEIREAGLANKFFAFTENVQRDSVVSVADHVTATLDEFLYLNKLPMTISYPKNRINVLLLENIHPRAQEIFTQEGYTVEVVSTALDEEELAEKIRNVSILGIRSKTNVTEKVLANANKLIAIGTFCIGTNQVDLKAALDRGIPVFNAPYSNTRSVVELALGEIIILMRQVYQKSNEMHQGIWKKNATNSFEIRGKRLGIVGYGNIGTQLSVLAEGLGMQVLYYDLVDKLGLGNAHKCKSLEELLTQADVISLHTDGRKENTHLIGETELNMMKDGAILINLSRGHIVDIAALTKALKTGKIGGAGLDVFPHEPKNNKEEFLSELRGLPNVILTPHIGGSTEEAQLNIATYVPDKLIEYVNTGSSYMSVNFPNIQLPSLLSAHRLMHVHRNVPGILAKINSVLADNKVNIIGQYLKTNERIGYVITDVDKSYSDATIQDLKKIPDTIKFRVLY